MVEVNREEWLDEETQKAHEENLLLRSVSGDLDAFSELVEFHQEKIIRLAYSFLHNWEDARDAAQMVFVKAYKSIRDFNEESSFSTWLYRIAVNQCKDFLRKRKVRSHLSVSLKKDEVTEREPAEHRLEAREGTEENLLNKELLAEIQKASNKLPAQQKTVFVLRYFEGLSINDIAETLGLSTGAIKSNLFQAVQKMRKTLQKYLEIEGVA